MADLQTLLAMAEDLVLTLELEALAAEVYRHLPEPASPRRITIPTEPRAARDAALAAARRMGLIAT